MWDSRSNQNNIINDDINRSILIVDDEQDIVNLIKRSLEVNGTRVCAFTDPFLAVKHFNSEVRDHHNIVISDIRMLGMNGYEFVKKTKEINKKVKTILMSAFEINDKEFHNILPDIRVDAFLQKPFHIKQLNEVVEKISIRA
jgi:response regulator RpfG family c-di-GMP phosphodiesterase